MQKHIRYLYKYFPPERIDVFETMMVSFTRPKWFNDPFELNPRILFEQSKKDKNKAKKSLYDSYTKTDQTISFEEYQKEADERLKKQTEKYLGPGFCLGEFVLESQHLGRMNHSVGLFCLTKHPKNLLMWAHYASSHTGFVIELIQDELFWDTTGFPLKVRYVNKRPILDLDSSDDEYMHTFLAKGKEWSYEDEYRIVGHFDDLKEVPIGNTSIYMGSIHPESIGRVIMGCKMNDSDKEKIYEILSNPKYKKAKLLEARVHTRDFSLAYSDYKNIKG